MNGYLSMGAWGWVMLLAGTLAHGGTEVGNGGGAVVCRDVSGEVTSIELLDYYEARVLRGMTIDLGGPELSVREKIRLALSRLAMISPLKAARYAQEADSFLQGALFIPGVNLVFSEDTTHSLIPRGCSVEQVVTQRTPQFPGERRYTVSLDLWSKMDSAQQAGLILHEAIYREALGYLHTTSTHTRYFNAAIGANALRAAHTDLDVLEFYRMVRFGVGDLHGIEVAVEAHARDLAGNLLIRECELQFYPDGELRSFVPVLGGQIFFQGQAFTNLAWSGVNWLTLYSSGGCAMHSLNTQSIWIRHQPAVIRAKTPGDFLIYGVRYSCHVDPSSHRPWSLSFYPDGSVSSHSGCTIRR